VCRQFKEKFPGVPVPQRNTVRNLVVRLRGTGSFNDRTRKGKKKKRVLTEEKIGDIGQSLQRSPTKSLRRVSQETGVSKASAYRATKL
jgi:transposase